MNCKGMSQAKLEGSRVVNEVDKGKMVEERGQRHRGVNFADACTATICGCGWAGISEPLEDHQWKSERRIEVDQQATVVWLLWLVTTSFVH